MSRKYSLTSKAVRDMINIHNYIFFETSPEAARRVTKGLDEKILKIARLGLTGVACDEIAPRLRVLTHKNYRIYFRVVETQIHIVRILHGRQDASLNDFPESEN